MSVIRCNWCLKDELYMDYHDTEWGVPIYDDQKLFENLILESFQAGLSWYTILKKRESFRLAFDQFNAKLMAKYTSEDVSRLMQNAGIIRHKLKIESAIKSAQLFLDIQKKHGSFRNFIWQFTDGRIIVNRPKSITDIKSTSKQSDAMSSALKKLGFKFCGSTVCYAYMQAVGMVNDHLVDCHCADAKL
jgi:DNA-3-methyladenine glycosylase I